jgi:hypothetical protein
MSSTIRTPTPEQRGREMLKASGYGADPASGDPGYVPRKGWKRGGKVKGKHAAKRMDRRARGGAVHHDDEAEQKVRSGVHQHETAEHGGVHHKLRFADGGGIGPGAGRKSAKKPAVTVNIKTGGGQAEKQAAAQQGMRAGMAMGARAAAAQHAPMGGGPGGPPRPPMPPPGGQGMPMAGGMPPGGPRPPMGPPPMGGPGAGPQMVKRGGHVKGRQMGGPMPGEPMPQQPPGGMPMSGGMQQPAVAKHGGEVPRDRKGRFAGGLV